MAFGQVTFEVQVCQEGRWLTRESFGQETPARNLATALLSSGTLDGVKIIKVRQRGDVETETVVFSEMREAEKEKAERISVVSIEEANWCETVDDVYGFPARQTIGRVLRQWCDKQVITPVEMLHNVRELKRVSDFETLMPSAVNRVATIQARDKGGDAKARNNTLFDWAGKVGERVRAAAAIPDLPKIESHSFDFCLQKLERAVPAERFDHAALVVLANWTITTRSWLGKVEQCLQMLEDARHPRAAKLLDQLIADCLASTDAIRDLLGRQLNLSSAILCLIDLARGQMKVELKGDEEFVGRLNKHFGQTGLLPESREALIDGIRRQIRGRTPMTHGERPQQLEGYRRVVFHLMNRRGPLLGGSQMADAIVLGYGRYVEEGGATGRAKMIQFAPSLMESPADKARFILMALGGELMAEHKEAAVQQVRDIVRRAQGFADLVKPEQPAPDKLRAVAGLHELMATTDHVPEPLRASYLGKLDQFTADYLTGSGLLDKLDDPKASTRRRAIGLVQMAGSGALTPGKARAAVRDRVQRLMAAADFARSFVADIPDASQHQTALADFRAMVQRAELG
jgi:hypothetical protein